MIPQTRSSTFTTRSEVIQALLSHFEALGTNLVSRNALTFALTGTKINGVISTESKRRLALEHPVFVETKCPMSPAPDKAFHLTKRFRARVGQYENVAEALLCFFNSPMMIVV